MELKKIGIMLSDYQDHHYWEILLFIIVIFILYPLFILYITVKYLLNIKIRELYTYITR